MGRTGPQFLLFAVAAFGLVAAGCASVANPEGWAPPNLEEGTLYASVDKGKMAALDPDDLSVKWVFPPDTEEGDKLDLEGIYSVPIVSEGFVYFGAYDGNVYALDAAEGFLIWAFETDDPIVSSLALSGGTLFAGSTDGRLYAIDAQSGDEIGRFDTGSSIWASPLSTEIIGWNSVPAMGVVYVATMDGRLHALDPTTLAPIEGFSFETDAGLIMDPILADNDTLLAGGIDGNVYGLDPQTGDGQWSFEGGNWFWGKPALRGETAYIPDLDGNVYAVNLVDGRPVWTKPFKTEAAVRSSPLLVGNTMVVVDRDGNAYGVDPDNGTQVWGPTLLGKTVLSDPFLLERAASTGGTDSSPSATSAEGSPAPTSEPSPTTAAGEERIETVVLIVAQGGDLCTIDPADGSPVGSLLCAQVPL